jgi:1-phosphofructokinase family hexose kinase
LILAAGLTPAWQEILVFDGLRLGQVNRAEEVHWTASGKVLNVGLALHHLGGPSLTLALLGGLPGRAIDESFTAEGMAHRWVWASRPTRVCNTVLDRSSQVTTELVENAGKVREEELDAFLETFRECVAEAQLVVLSGSLPPGTPKTFYRELVELSPAPVILDASGQELLEALPARPLCVKPNREELGRSLGRQLRSDEELKEAMHEVHRRGAQWVLVSHGADSLWAYSGETFHRFHPPRIDAVNPIASGDCLAAGIAWALHEGASMVEAVRFGIAAAVENATTLLPARLDLNRVRARLAGII